MDISPGLMYAPAGWGKNQAASDRSKQSEAVPKQCSSASVAMAQNHFLKAHDLLLVESLEDLARELYGVFKIGVS